MQTKSTPNQVYCKTWRLVSQLSALAGLVLALPGQPFPKSILSTALYSTPAKIKPPGEPWPVQLGGTWAKTKADGYEEKFTERPR